MLRLLLGALLVLGPLSSIVRAGPRQVPMIDYVQDVWEPGAGGLPHPSVTAIRQTRDGYIWVATFTGVARFDGIEFKPPDIADERARAVLADHIRCIFEAQDGALWFGTRREGAIRLKDGAVRFLTVKDGLPINDVRAIEQTPDGTLWMATQDGVVSLSPSGALRLFGVAEGLGAKGAVALFVDTDGSVWAGTGNYGVARFDGTRFQNIKLEPGEGARAEQVFGVPLGSVGAIARDRAGTLWAGTSVGVMSVPEPGREASREIHPGAVNSLVVTARGDLWASTGRGLGRLRDGVWRLYTSQQGLLNDGLFSVYEDIEGSLWLGTRIGLARLRPRIIQAYTQRDGIGHDAVAAVIELRNGDIWAAHRNGASRLRDGQWTTISVADGLPHASVRTFAETPDGTLWIGTLDGLASYKDGRVKKYPGQGGVSVRGLAVDAEGHVWAATDPGLQRVEDGKMRIVVPLRPNCGETLLNSFSIDREGTFWVGTGTGLLRVKNGVVECFRDATILARNDVRSVVEDDEHRLWVATIGGLARWTGSGLEYRSHGLPPRIAIYGVLDDGLGAFWCNTPQGLIRVAKARVVGTSDSPALYREFGTADGMDTPVGTGGGVPSAWRGRDGRLWFTTATGLAVVDPSRIEEDAFHAPIYIDALQADRKPVDIKGPRRLPPGTRDVELRFAMLSFVAPERIQYKYKLDGYDRGWVDSGTRRAAFYTNLRPGRYTFHVRAANYGGVWSEQGTSVEFELLPHLYERRGFHVAAALGVVLLAFGAYSWRVRQVRAHERELERRVQEAVAQIRTLKGMLPICASCKKIRDDSGYWKQMETYIHEHSGADFSHGICPDCMARLYPDYAASSGGGPNEAA